MNINRITRLKEGQPNHQKKYVLYWMQQSQRVFYNHALEHAISLANEFNLPLLIYFGLTSHYPDANLRHYHFMLEGLLEVKTELAKKEIGFVFKLQSPEEGIQAFLKDAQALIMDTGYLRHQLIWRQRVYANASQQYPDLFIDIVDTDLIVPVAVASQKAEYGAYTLRPKLMRLYQEFMDFKSLLKVNITWQLTMKSDDDLSDLTSLEKKLNLDESVLPSKQYHGGYKEAKQHLYDFLKDDANEYPLSNDPGFDRTSKLSMYLHFGQISALEILDEMNLAMINRTLSQEAYEAFFEQLLVRRELAFNYVAYHRGYDKFETMTEPWAYQSLREHNQDYRTYLYTVKEMESYQTHDPYFNAAMKEMVISGYMHNYMRMYWAKKIIEWTQSHKQAYETILYLNNRYFLDGRDPNSYAGVAWCFGKHDRAWTERPIFGKLRYMNDKGLERKFDMDSFIKRINDLK